MTVAHLRTEMSNAEFVQWTVWFARRAQQQELEQKKAAWRR